MCKSTFFFKHLINVLTFFPPDWGMLRRSRCKEAYRVSVVVHTTYMGFIGVRLSAKMKGFYFIRLWYILYRVQYDTAQYKNKNIR